MKTEEEKPNEKEFTPEIPERYKGGDVEYAAKEFKFHVRPAPDNTQIELIEFEDGRKYKFQHPPFMTAHAVLIGSDSQHQPFVYGLSCLKQNGQGPEINESYLDQNRSEGFDLWSPLVRGLLSCS